MNHIISPPTASCICAIAGTERLGNNACSHLLASNLRETGACGYEINSFLVVLLFVFVWFRSSVKSVQYSQYLQHCYAVQEKRSQT